MCWDFNLNDSLKPFVGHLHRTRKLRAEYHCNPLSSLDETTAKHV